MNITNFEHAVFALLIQIVIGLVTGNWWAGAAAGTFFFLGREHAQFEKKLTKGGPVDNLNPFAGFQFWKWSLDSQLDLVFPAVATLVVVIAYELGADPVIVSAYSLLVVLSIMDNMLSKTSVNNQHNLAYNIFVDIAMRIINTRTASVLSTIIVFVGAPLVIVLGGPYSSYILTALCAIYAVLVVVKLRNHAARK